MVYIYTHGISIVRTVWKTFFFCFPPPPSPLCNRSEEGLEELCGEGGVDRSGVGQWKSALTARSLLSCDSMTRLFYCWFTERDLRHSYNNPFLTFGRLGPPLLVCTVFFFSRACVKVRASPPFFFFFAGPRTYYRYIFF